MGAISDLFLTFFKIGLFTFGGGYAMISIIENICVERKHWITHEDMMGITVIAESTPGPIAINCATFVGLTQAGIPGSIAATAGVALPSFIIIYLVSTVLDNFLEIQLIANAFRGIKIGVGLLILSVGLKMAKKLPKKPLPCIIMAAAFLSLIISAILIAAMFLYPKIAKKKLSPIMLILISAVLGIIVY